MRSNALALTCASVEGLEVLVELGSDDKAFEGEVPNFANDAAVSEVSSAFVIGKAARES